MKRTDIRIWYHDWETQAKIKAERRGSERIEGSWSSGEMHRCLCYYFVLRSFSSFFISTCIRDFSSFRC